VKSKRFIAASGLIILLIVGGASSANATSKSPISIRVDLEATTAKDGEPILGFAILTNSSSKTVVVESCASDGWLFVGLANKGVPFRPIVLTDACVPSIKLRPGANQFAVKVATTYQECGMHSAPFCAKSGSPALPRGTYHLDVITLGLPKGTRVLTRSRVTLS
jgi:hypothetical protein